MIIKRIFRPQTSLPKSYLAWVGSYTQYPNDFPIFNGYLCTWDAVYQHISCFDKNPNLILQESKTETLYIDRGFHECKTWIYATIDEVYIPDEFEMKIIRQRLNIGGGIPKLISSQSPYYLEDFDYVVYGLKR